MSANDLFDLLGKLPISRSGDRAPRCATNVAVKAVLADSGDTPLRLRAVNISRSGILLRHNAPQPQSWKIGSQLELVIDSDPRYFTVQIECRATIARIIPELIECQQSTLFGLQFIFR